MKDNKKYLNDDEISKVTGGVSESNAIASIDSIASVNSINASADLEVNELAESNGILSANSSILEKSVAAGKLTSNIAGNAFESKARPSKKNPSLTKQGAFNIKKPE